MTVDLRVVFYKVKKDYFAFEKRNDDNDEYMYLWSLQIMASTSININYKEERRSGVGTSLLQ